MERINTFMTDDGSVFDVPESQLGAFAQDAEDKGEFLREVKKYADAEGSIFDVPEDKHEAFMQDAQAQGVQLEPVNTVQTMGGLFDVPVSKAQGFHDDWLKDPESDKEREDAAKGIAEKLDKPDSPIWAGVKGFFSGEGWFNREHGLGASANAANALRALASAPATIADKVGAAEQFQSRVRELPGMKSIPVATGMLNPVGLAGMGLEALLSLKGKDGGKEYREVIQKARDYVDAKREEWLGYRNEKGEKAGGDFATTLGAQAINSVAESYLLTAPKVMQGMNAAMRAGGTGLASRLTPTLQTMLYGASTAEGTASKAEAKGFSNEKAVGIGLLTGTIESALESVSQVFGMQDAMTKNAMKEAVARTVWKKAGEVLKDATGEGLTEFGQQFQQGAIERISKIDEKTWDQIGMESASAMLLGIISGGASASANGIFNNPRQGAADPNTEASDELRANEEAAAVGMGRMAQQESVLEGDPAAASPGEGAFQGQGPVESGAIAPRQGAEQQTPRQGAADPAQPLIVNGDVKALPEKTGRGVRLVLPSGKSLVSMDPGLAALTEYWYKDRVLFPAAPQGDTGRQEGDIAMNAGRRAGFDVKPGKTVLVNVGRSKKSYLGHVVQVLDNNTVRVKIDKTQRSLKNNREGYADVDVRQLAQLPAVIGKQRRDELMKGMTPEQRKSTESNAQTFERELVDQGYFLNQESWMEAEALGDTKRGKLAKAEELKAAYRRASQMLGIPLDNHVQRAAALELLRDFHAGMQGTETTPYDVQAELLARDGEQEMQALRGSGDFSLAEMTPEEMEAADARLEAQRNAQDARSRMLARADAPLEGDAGDLTGELFGAFDEMPLFGQAADANGNVDGSSKQKRFDVGKKLTKEERAAILKTARDVYRENNIDKEERTDSRGEPYFAYPYSPEYFIKSDITGKSIRYYVTLPDGRIAHPTELFPNYTEGKVEELIRQSEAQEAKKKDDIKFEYLSPEHLFETEEEAYNFWSNLSRKPYMIPMEKRMTIKSDSKYAIVPIIAYNQNKDVFNSLGFSDKNAELYNADLGAGNMAQGNAYNQESDSKEDSYTRDYFGKDSAPYLNGNTRFYRGIGSFNRQKLNADNGLTFWTDNKELAEYYAKNKNKQEGILIEGHLYGHYLDLTDNAVLWKLKTDMQRRGYGKEVIEILSLPELQIVSTTNDQEHNDGWKQIEQYLSQGAFGVQGVMFLDQHFENGGYEKTYASFPGSAIYEDDPTFFNMAQGKAYNQEASGGAETPAAQETRVPMEGSGDGGNFAVGMDLMDAVQMFYQLRGKLPKIRERMRAGAMGLFRPGSQDIELLAGIFGLYDQQDSDRIRDALVKKGYEGERLERQLDVEVRALIEKRRTQNMKKPLKVMVHELAHYVDFLPDSDLKRGNILGHIAALKKYLKQSIGPEPGAPGPVTEQEKAAMRRRVEREMKMVPVQTRQYVDEVIRENPQYKILGVTADDVRALLGTDGRTATPELYDWFSRQDSDVKRAVLAAAMKGVIDERVGTIGNEAYTQKLADYNKNYSKEASRRRFRELLREETAKRRLIEIDQIKAEAESIIPWWRGAKEMEAYFRQPEEMYAELFGIFLADPSELRSRAPTVYRAFSGWMDARPEVAEAYRAYLDFRNLPAEQQARQKLANFKRGMEKGDEDSRREATELARKPGRWAALDSFGYYFHRRTAPIKWALDRSLKVLVDAAPTDTEKAKVKDIYETALVGIKQQSAISRVIQDYEAQINARVADPLARNGFDMLDLGVYQALRRVAYELDGKAAPAGVEPASALKLLESMRQEYGEERWNALQEAAMEFRRIREARIISNPDLRAMYDKALLEKLDNNVEYVTFQRVPTMEEIKQFKEALRKAKSGDKLLREDVAEFLTREMENRLGSAVGAKIHRFVGSFGPVANPIVATLTKDDQLIRSATRNTLKRQIYEFVKESGLDLIREVQYEKNGQGIMVPKMVDDPNWKTVVYMQNGQVKGYLANKSLAKSLETGRTEEIAFLRNAMRVNGDITKMYTQLKYSFSYMNNIRDLERAANYVPGMERMRLAPGVNINFLPGGGMISTLMRYKMPSELFKKVLPWTMNDRMVEWHLYQARRAAILIQSNTIEQAEAQAQELMRMGDTRKAEQLFDDVRLAREGLANPILMSHIEAIREDSTADDYTRRLYRYGIQKDEITRGLHLAARIGSVFKWYGRTVEGWGEVGELTTKLATWKFLETHGKDMSQQKKILVTRELGGSPDFSERGAAASYVEFITRPFANAAKEGTIGWAKAFQLSPKETVRKMVSNVIAPTIVRHVLSSGLGLAILKFYMPDDEEREKSWIYNWMKWYYDSSNNVPSYILKSYSAFPIPVKVDDSGLWTLILRMPMDQTSQLISLITWNTMDTIGETILNSIENDGVPNVLSRSERPGLEIIQALVGSTIPMDVAEGPGAGVLGLTFGYVFGTNFYDSFKERYVFNEDDLISRGSFSNGAWKNAFGIYLGEMSNKLGGGIFKRYNKDNIFGAEPPTLHKMLNAPIIQSSIGSFVNVYSGGQAQMERKLKRIEKEFDAPVKVEARNDFARAVKEGGGKSVNYSDDIIAKMLNKDGKDYSDLVKSQIYSEEFTRLTAEYYRTKNIRESVGQPQYNAYKEDNPIMRDIRIDVTERGL